MAQKSAKVLATRNASRLNNTHLITLTLHILFLVFRALTFRATFTRTSFLLYLAIWTPGLLVEYALERSGRPKYTTFDASQSNLRGTSNVELRSAGDDLDQEGGVMEMMWDLLYWTWGCTCAAGVLGDWGWSLWLVVPMYGAFKAYELYAGARGMAGLNAGAGGEGSSSGPSKRQQKMEKRGGQKMVFYG